jgi:hypothetical protein
VLARPADRHAPRCGDRGDDRRARVRARDPVLRAPPQAGFQVVTAQLTRGTRFGFVESSGLASDLGRHARGIFDLLPDAGACSLRSRWASARAPSPAARVDACASLSLALAACGALAFAPQLALGQRVRRVPDAALGAARARDRNRRSAAELDRRGAGRVPRAAIALALGAWCAIHFARAGERWIGSEGFRLRGVSARRAAALGRARAGPDCTMLTLETELAVEAGCRVVPGLEYSYFSYFAELPRRRGAAARL